MTSKLRAGTCLFALWVGGCVDANSSGGVDAGRFEAGSSDASATGEVENAEVNPTEDANHTSGPLTRDDNVTATANGDLEWAPDGAAAVTSDSHSRSHESRTSDVFLDAATSLAPDHNDTETTTGAALDAALDEEPASARPDAASVTSLNGDWVGSGTADVHIGTSRDWDVNANASVATATTFEVASSSSPEVDTIVEPTRDSSSTTFADAGLEVNLADSSDLDAATSIDASLTFDASDVTTANDASVALTITSSVSPDSGATVDISSTVDTSLASDIGDSSTTPDASLLDSIDSGMNDEPNASTTATEAGSNSTAVYESSTTATVELSSAGSLDGGAQASETDSGLDAAVPDASLAHDAGRVTDADVDSSVQPDSGSAVDATSVETTAFEVTVVETTAFETSTATSAPFQGSSTPNVASNSTESDASTITDSGVAIEGGTLSADPDAQSSNEGSSAFTDASVVQMDAGALDDAATDAAATQPEDAGFVFIDAATEFATSDTAASGAFSNVDPTTSAPLSIATDAGEDAAATDASTNGALLDASFDAGLDITTDSSTSEAPEQDAAPDTSLNSSNEDSNSSAAETLTDAGTSEAPFDSGSGEPIDGRQLFEEAEFGGNGRTCLTCHSSTTGTISPDEIQTLFETDPNGPMFRSIDSNDGVGDDYSELLERATFRVELALPSGVTLVSDPTARSIVLRRSVPTTLNTPALDPTLMWDGRATDLLDQALGAITGHAEGTSIPTEAELEAIAEFEQSDAFFSSELLRNFAQGGPAPDWPPGNTAAERRGRRWFAEDPRNAPRFNICGQCHGGPMTNETQQNSGLPVGEHFQTANVSEFNTKGNPTYEFLFPDPDNPGSTISVTTPDPGLALTTGDVRDVNFFKIPPLWGISNTAPYFHDNSAATLEELMDHYEDHLATFLFAGFPFPFPHVPTAQDKADIVAYMRLL